MASLAGRQKERASLACLPGDEAIVIDLVEKEFLNPGGFYPLMTLAPYPAPSAGDLFHHYYIYQQQNHAQTQQKL